MSFFKIGYRTCFYLFPWHHIIRVGKISGQAAIQFRFLYCCDGRSSATLNNAIPNRLNQFNLRIIIKQAYLLQKIGNQVCVPVVVELRVILHQLIDDGAILWVSYFLLRVEYNFGVGLIYNRCDQR